MQLLNLIKLLKLPPLLFLMMSIAAFGFAHAQDLSAPASSSEKQISAPAADVPGLGLGHAVAIGLVEGITEFLPVSSTGHLIILNTLLGYRDESALTPEYIAAVKAYEIVVQIGAILAVLLLYWRTIWSMTMGLVGRSAEGRRLMVVLLAAFIPTAVIGLLLKDIIKAYLFNVGGVAMALALGAFAIFALERRRSMGRPSFRRNRQLGELGWRDGVMLGFMQCLALWPGMSRSMVTILGGMSLGLKQSDAAELSFLLGFVTLSAASCFEMLDEGELLVNHLGFQAIVIGIVVAGVSAALAIRLLLGFLNHYGMLPFAWYRLGLAILLWFYARGLILN